MCPSVFLCVCLSVCLSVHLSVCLSVCPSVRLSVCSSVYLSVCLSACDYIQWLWLSSICYRNSSHFFMWVLNVADLFFFSWVFKTQSVQLTKVQFQQGIGISCCCLSICPFFSYSHPPICSWLSVSSLQPLSYWTLLLLSTLFIPCQLLILSCFTLHFYAPLFPYSLLFFDLSLSGSLSKPSLTVFNCQVTYVSITYASTPVPAVPYEGQPGKKTKRTAVEQWKIRVISHI